jgi:hypothetical protein
MAAFVRLKAFLPDADNLALKRGMVSQDLVESFPGSDQAENVAFANSHTTDARAVSALSFFDGDSLQAIFAHRMPKMRFSHESGGAEPGEVRAFLENLFKLFNLDLSLVQNLP